MVSNAFIKKGTIFEDSGCSVMARIAGGDGQYITQASISSIVGKVFNALTSEELATLTVIVANTVFNTLQTDSRWSEDATGYNFRHDIPAASFSAGSKIYRIEYKFTATGGEIFFVVYELSAINVMSS